MATSSDILITDLPSFTDFDQNDVTAVTDVSTNITRKYSLGNILAGLVSKIVRLANGTQATTQDVIDNSDLIATTAFVNNVINNTVATQIQNLGTSNLFSSLKETNGYQYLPGGLIFQWGYFDATTNVHTIAFNVPFNVCLNISITNHYTGLNIKNAVHTTQVTNNDFTYWSENTNGNIYWFAIGY